MAKQASNFMIGLFVTIGITLVIGVIVWVGASQYFEKGNLYVTYFDESVQGLQKDTMVKYRGVDIGRIVRIAVAPDKRLIEVVMKIDLNDHLEADSIAQLRSVGLTGIAFIELDRRDSTTSKATPRIDFTAPYPVIPSRPSEVRQILTGIDNAIDKVNNVDFLGISEQIKTTAQAANNFLSGSRTERIMTNMESSLKTLDQFMSKLDKVMTTGELEGTLLGAKQTMVETRSLIGAMKKDVIDKLGNIDFRDISELIKTTAQRADNFLSSSRTERIMVNLDSATLALDKSMSRLEKIIAAGTLEETLSEARQTMAETRLLIAGLHHELKSMKLADTADKANRMIDSLDQTTRTSSVNIQLATENLRSILESLERLIERLENNPSDLLLSRPPEQRSGNY